MPTEFLPFSKPCVDEEDISAVVEVLRSGWITTGPKCAELEAIVSEITGCRHAVALSSATAGMHLALHAHNIGPGDEVITPSLTWVSTINLITACGATPVFADIDRDHLMVTADTIKPLITERTRLIIPVHYAGAAVDLDSLQSLLDNQQISIIEDAAHAIGTKYAERSIGADGTVIYSFHPIKNVTTGEGGMLCTDDEEFALRIRRLKFHGLGADAFDRNTQGRAPQAEVIEPGFKYNLPDMNAVLGIGQLRRLDSMIERRSELAHLYLQQLESVEQVIPLRVPQDTSRHAWHLFIVRLDTEKSGITRDEFMSELKKRGIGTGLHFRAAHTQKYYRENMPAVPRLPNTEWNSERICSLPLFPEMRDDDVGRVVDAIKSILGSARL